MSRKLLIIIIGIILLIFVFLIIKKLQKGKKYDITPADEQGWSPSPLSEKFDEAYNSWSLFDVYDEPTIQLNALNNAQFKSVHNDYNRRFMQKNGNKNLDESIMNTWRISNSVLNDYKVRRGILFQ